MHFKDIDFYIKIKNSMTNKKCDVLILVCIETFRFTSSEFSKLEFVRLSSSLTELKLRVLKQRSVVI